MKSKIELNKLYSNYKLVNKMHIRFENNKFKKFFMWLWYFISLPFVFLFYKFQYKDFLKSFLKGLLVIAIIVAIAISGYFILKACGFTTVDDFKELRNKLGDSFAFWLVIALLQIVQVIFIPISNQIITVPLALIFPINDLWKVYLCSWISIWIATIILYFIGRLGGKKILNWILSDKEQTDKCTNFLNRGWIFYPLAMLLPLPDDIVTILAGTSKMSFVFVSISSFFTRAIDVACSVWGIGYLTRCGWWGWLLLAIGVCLLGLITYLFYKWDKKHRKGEQIND